MSAVFENFGISFLYPENWELTDESPERQGGPQSITVQSPSGGFWTLNVYSPGGDPRELADQVRLTMATEYEGLESQAVDEEVQGERLIGYDMDFYCLDFVVSAQVRSVRIGRKTYVLFCQAESRDFDQLAPVFQAMKVSLLRSTG